MVLSLFSRHPRYAVTSAVGILVVLLLLASRQEDSWIQSPPFMRHPGGRPPFRGHSVKARLEEAEEDYSINVGRRNALIRTVGPDPSKIAAWPELNRKHHMYTLWDFFLPAFRCPHKVERVGVMGDGGKWVCGLEKIAREKKRPCVVYSVGINGESSFEAELMKQTNCEVWGYDYSVKSFGPEIEEDPELKPRGHFHPYALGKTDNHAPGQAIPFYTLPTLMKMNGHDFIDVLKIDIEGYEFEVLSHLVSEYKDKPLPFGQLQLEVHAWSKSFLEFLTWWQSLEAAGLRPFYTEPNLVYLNLYRGHAPDLSEYSFINIQGNHAIIRD